MDKEIQQHKYTNQNIQSEYRENSEQEYSAK